MTPQEYGSYERAKAAGGETWRGWEHKQVGDWYVDPNETRAKVLVSTGTFIGTAWGLAELVEEAAERFNFQPNLIETAGALGLAGLAAYGIWKGLDYLFHPRKE